MLKIVLGPQIDNTMGLHFIFIKRQILYTKMKTLVHINSQTPASHNEICKSSDDDLCSKRYFLLNLEIKWVVCNPMLLRFFLAFL